MRIYREKLYIEKDGKKVYGEQLPVIIKNNGYSLTDLTVFEDETINCWGFKNLEQIKEEISSGRLSQTIPDNAELVCSLGLIKTTKFLPDITNDDFIKVIEDTINRLNHRETRSTICETSFKNYLLNPIELNFNKLKDTYNDLPLHQKVLFEYIDEKDPLCNLMAGREQFTESYRVEVLKHYFKIEL